MKGRSAAFVVFAIALVSVVAYVWLRDREPDAASLDPVDEPPAVVGISTALTPAKPEPLPPPEVEPPAASPAEVAAQRYAAQNMVGYRREFRSVDFDIYFVFMTLGDASEVIDAAGTLKDRAWINAIQQEYGLADEEVQKLLLYSRTALEADRKYQAAQQDEVCAARSNFASLQQFGEVLNGYTGKVRENQEAMGRQAESELGPALFSKISSRIRSKPRQEVIEGDFAALLPARNQGLDVEVERFCSFGK